MKDKKVKVPNEARTVAENIKEVLGGKYFKTKTDFNYHSMLKKNKIQRKRSIYDPTIKGPEVIS